MLPEGHQGIAQAIGVNDCRSSRFDSLHASAISIGGDDDKSGNVVRRAKQSQVRTKIGNAIEYHTAGWNPGPYRSPHGQRRVIDPRGTAAHCDSVEPGSKPLDVLPG